MSARRITALIGSQEYPQRIEVREVFPSDLPQFVICETPAGERLRVERPRVNIEPQGD